MTQEPSQRSILSWNHGVVAGTQTTFDDAVRVAGLTNAAKVTGHKRVSMEQLVAWNPTTIVLECAPTCEASKQTFIAQPGAHALRAVQNKRLLSFESRHLSSTGFGILTLIEELLRTKESTL
ncbi:MAG: ABC transporter substrate-binding protein [Myxococcota bacterium]